MCVVSTATFDWNPYTCVRIWGEQASSFFNKNLTNADSDNNMNITTKMEMSLVNKPANNV